MYVTLTTTLHSEDSTSTFNTSQLFNACLISIIGNLSKHTDSPSGIMTSSNSIQYKQSIPHIETIQKKIRRNTAVALWIYQTNLKQIPIHITHH